MGEAAARAMAQVLDGINIDVKAFSEKFYQQVCKAHLAPVLANVRLLHDLGLWVEITTLIIPGWNDSDSELREIAAFIRGISADIPWHVTAFHPTYKMLDRPATPASSLRRAMEIGCSEGLNFVYCGNIPGTGGESTRCPSCRAVIIDRFGFSASDLSSDGNCPSCGAAIAGVW
jgi:pyruvate formate lyase activating enzyme